MTRTTSLILLIIQLTSCNRDLTIKNVIVIDRLFSPDSSYVALTYYVDNGAMGQSLSMTSVLKVADTVGILNNSLLPCLDLPFNACYFPDRWLDNQTLQVFLHEIPFIKAGLPFDSTGISISGVTCKVIPYDYSNGLIPLIDYVSFSNDRKKLLVAYRYKCDLNISVINYGDKLPKFGNILTKMEIEYNPIVYAKWNANDIDMFMIDARMYETSNYINEKIPYKVNFVDVNELQKSFNGYKCFSFFPLYDDKQTEELLNQNDSKTYAIISDASWHINNNDTTEFYTEYQYVYDIDGQPCRSYFRINQKNNKKFPYKQGDTINIKYDPRQTLIHKMENKYSR